MTSFCRVSEADSGLGTGLDEVYSYFDFLNSKYDLFDIVGNSLIN